MAKEEQIQLDGTVVEKLPNAMFRVRLDNEHQIIAYTAGKMRKHRTRVMPGDRVQLEMTPYDLSKGGSPVAIVDPRRPEGHPVVWDHDTARKVPRV